MSHYDYERSIQIAIQDEPFAALIMAAMRQASDNNLKILQLGWPHIWTEFIARYNAPGGVLPGDEVR